MKCFDYNAVVVDGEVYCVGHQPKDIRLDDPACQPIFADSEWSYAPVCSVCGCEHDYMTLLPEVT